MTTAIPTTDCLRRDDINPPAPAPPKRVLRVRWGIMRGSRLATQRLYTAAQAKRFVKIAARFGADVYTSCFGKVWVEEK